MKKLLPYLSITLLVFVFFWQFFIKGYVSIPADSLVGLYHPFRDYLAKDYERGYPFKNFLITDPILQQYPWRQLSIDSEKKGILPLWNPYSGAGEPLLANIQSSSLYPLNVFLLVFPFMQGWMLLVIMQMLLGGVFTFLFLRNLDLKNESSIFGASAYILSGFYFSWLTWNSVLHVAMWLPLVLLSIDKLTKDNDQKTTAKLYWPIIIVFSLSSAFFAGHLQLFFYLFLISLFYFILRIYSVKQRIKKSVILGISLLIFLFITFIQWFPAINLIQLSSRTIDQMNWQSKEGWFIPLQHLIQFIAPDFFGNPATLNYWGTWNYGELNGYIGAITLCMAIFAVLVKKEKTVVFFFLSILVAVLFSVSNFISKIPFELQLPLISSSQPTRLIFIIDFALAVLSAYGIEELLKNKNNRKKLFFVTLSLTLILFGVWTYIILNKENDANLAIAQRNFYLPSILIIGQGIIFLMAHYLRNKQKIILCIFYLLLTVNIFDLMRYGFKFNPFVPKSLVYPNTKITSYLSNESRDYPWRFMGSDYVKDQKRILPPNISVNYRIFGIDNYNPLLLKNYQEFIAVSEWGFIDIPDVSFNRIIIPNNYSSRLVDLLGVKYVVTLNDTTSEKLKYLFKEGESRVYENINVFPRAFMVYSFVLAETKQKAGSFLLDINLDLRKTAIIEKNLNIENGNNTENKVQFISYADNAIELSVETSRKGILILTDNYYPGWIATIDGDESEILKVDYTFRGLIIPAGKHIVEFKLSKI